MSRNDPFFVEEMDARQKGIRLKSGPAQNELTLQVGRNRKGMQPGGSADYRNPPDLRLSFGETGPSYAVGLPRSMLYCFTLKTAAVS